MVTYFLFRDEVLHVLHYITFPVPLQGKVYNFKAYYLITRPSIPDDSIQSLRLFEHSKYILLSAQDLNTKKKNKNK